MWPLMHMNLPPVQWGAAAAEARFRQTQQQSAAPYSWHFVTRGRFFRGETVTELTTPLSNGKGYVFEPLHSDEVMYDYLSVVDPDLP